MANCIRILNVAVKMYKSIIENDVSKIEQFVQSDNFYKKNFEFLKKCVNLNGLFNFFTISE